MRTWLRWFSQVAIPLVRPPTAAPVRAASAEMMDASRGLHFYYGDAGGRGPSEISRELRCPDR